MKVAITGSNGLFGRGIARVLGGRHTVIPLSHADLEITSAENVNRVLGALRPDIIIHTAANPDPDKCQLDPENAHRINVEGTANVVSAAREFASAVAFISTDAVFDGSKPTPYFETDPPHPLSIYGETKVAAEREVQNIEQHWIFRVSVLFGPGKINFISKGLGKIARGETYTVASDQVGSATYTIDAAAVIEQVIESRRYGLYHLSNQGRCSRLELARHAAVLAGLDATTIAGLPLEQMNRPGPRPKCTEMGMQALERAGIPLPRSWQQALAEYLQLEGFRPKT